MYTKTASIKVNAKDFDITCNSCNAVNDATIEVYQHENGCKTVLEIICNNCGERSVA